MVPEDDPFDLVHDSGDELRTGGEVIDEAHCLAGGHDAEVDAAVDPWPLPQNESDQTVDRLRRHGVEVRHDTSPTGGHGLTDRDNKINTDSEIAGLLISRLHPESPPRCHGTAGPLRHFRCLVCAISSRSLPSSR
jgi:hypothetical protein